MLLKLWSGERCERSGISRRDACGLKIKKGDAVLDGELGQGARRTRADWPEDDVVVKEPTPSRPVRKGVGRLPVMAGLKRACGFLPPSGPQELSLPSERALPVAEYKKGLMDCSIRPLAFHISGPYSTRS